MRRTFFGKFYQEMAVWPDKMSLYGKTDYVHPRRLHVIPRYDLRSQYKNIYNQTEINGEEMRINFKRYFCLI